jgi:hypothetical protein
MDGILLTHCIDPASLRQNDFEKFVAARKRSLLTKIEAVMGKSSSYLMKQSPKTMQMR